MRWQNLDLSLIFPIKTTNHLSFFSHIILLFYDKKMIANTYLAIDFPKQTGIFANSSKKGVNDIEIQRK